MKNYFKYLAIFLVPLSIYSFNQQNLTEQSSIIFSNTKIRMDEGGKTPVEIRFNNGVKIYVSSFFNEYKKIFGISDDNEFVPFKVYTDQLGQTHHRIKQYYKGIEVAEVQYLLHEKEELIHYAHGKLIHGLNLDVRPSISEQEALKYALKYINAESYMWQNPKNEAFIKKAQDDPDATYYPGSEVKISAGINERRSENFKLVYRFDIFAEKPLGRYNVDIDAHSGEIIAVVPTLYHGDVQGLGTSLDYGVVPITVSDADFQLPPGGWHLNTWNRYGDSGESWWMADTGLGNQGGYGNLWYEVLDTDTMTLVGLNTKLSFYHRYAIEPPGDISEYMIGFDGWDGINVRISTDEGHTWQVLSNPSPSYTCDSLLSFGEVYGEGLGIPGWADRLDEWTNVVFDLSSFIGNTVKFRFALASDSYLSTSDFDPDLFGWQIDNILVYNATDTLFRNEGDESRMTASTIAKEVMLIEGNYRLREVGRGGGITTYNAQNLINSGLAVDFVDSDSNFTDPYAQAGVSAHWATEATYDYYLSQHNRNSYDNEGGRLISFVHFGDGFSNAFWTGWAAHYGDGRDNLWPWTALDVVAHEITHGVTQHSAGLSYPAEAGALNESFSDIFATAVEFFKLGDNGNWSIGEDIPRGGQGFRYLSNPNYREHPDTYKGTYWIPYTEDQYIVYNTGISHVNGGVQNHWFYLLSEGGSGINDNGHAYSVTGIGIEQAAQIAYRNLTVYLMPTSQYYDARLGSINAAIDLFGRDSHQYRAVLDAWNAVGVNYPFVGPYATQVLTNDVYLVPELDTLVIRTNIVNPENQLIDVNAIIQSSDQSKLDTIPMFDDGNHQDSTVGDGIFGTYWPIPSGEKYYSIHIITASLDSGYNNILQNGELFTTTGPVVFDSYNISSKLGVLMLKLFLRNTGKESSVTDITLDLTTSDTTSVDDITTTDLSAVDIAAGQVVEYDQPFYIRTKGSPDTINFNIDIYSNGYHYWGDSFIIDFATNLPKLDQILPRNFSLAQNYPNPFNPSTKIKFELPKPETVTIKVYNIIGQKIETLLQKPMPAGYHEVTFNAQNLSSGIYLYKIESGSFQDVKKMILLR